MEGRFHLEKLLVSKVLRKNVNEYQSMFSHVVAAMQMIQKGKKLKTGELVDYLFVDAEHSNPCKKVVPASIIKKIIDIMIKRSISR